MANKTATVFVTGTVYWAKIVGEGALHPNYDGDAREWSYELEPDDTSFLKEHRLLDRLKDPMAYANRLEDRGESEKAEKAREQAEGRGDYLVLRKPELTANGDKNEPIRIYDADNTPWDDRLIGNGSKVVAKLTIKDWGTGKKKSIYTAALRVMDLVPYESDEFGAYDAEQGSAPAKKPTKAKGTAKSKAGSEFDDLDDDIPFD